METMSPEALAKILVKAFKRGNKVLICGNGGSATMSSHFAGELVGKYKKERPPLPAIALNDLAVITAISNDYGYFQIFRRQVEALGKKGDILITLSTSGKSANILWAQQKAEEIGMEVIAFPTNKETGLDTAGTQEEHLKLLHKVSELVESRMFS